MTGTPDTADAPYWSIPEAALLTRLRADSAGLPATEVAIRRARSPHEAEPSRLARTLKLGVELGRVTFANTLKYVFMATSANFGNMFSMAGASLFLPFLPLLPQQVLLTNLLTDIREMTIARDAADPEAVAVPRRWDVAFIRRFMVVFGLLSSVFDYATFGVLHWLGASPAVFRSGWFVESVLSASLIVLVVRTRRPFVRSRPGRALLLTTLGTVLVTALIPFSFGAERLGFAPVPGRFLAALGVILLLYMVSAELAKRWFFKHEGSRPQPLVPHR